MTKIFLRNGGRSRHLSNEGPMLLAIDLLEHISILARTRRGRLAALARGEGLTAEDAVDAVQDALATLLVLDERTLPTVDAEWDPFLVTLVRNAARNKRRRHFLSRPHEDLDGHEIRDQGADADVALARAEEHVRLRSCVAELCDTQRAVVTLRMLEEQPGEDVAKTLGLSSGHVAVLLHRAKAALLTCMTD
jgi:RNA polymerase sigma-70 factor (ECF subfamily)